MEVLDDVPRLSIPWEAGEGYSRNSSLAGRPVTIPAGGAVLAEILLAVELAAGSCVVCGRVDRSGLLRRVSRQDRCSLRTERIVFTCSACDTAFVRVDGRA